MKILIIANRSGRFIVDVNEAEINNMPARKREILKDFVVNLLTPEPIDDKQT